jgi:methyl-accepting chemotaxis protein
VKRGRAALLAACVGSGVVGSLFGAFGGPLVGAAAAAIVGFAAAALALKTVETPAETRLPLSSPALAPAPPPPAALPLSNPKAQVQISQALESFGPEMESELDALRVRLGEDMIQLKKLHALALDLRGNLSELATRVSNAAVRNGQLLEGAERDGAQVGLEIQALVGVKEALNQGTQVIDDLAKSTREVGPVIESIFVVARKTNMLALNAAIEAARAGEQGRGFAVVAEEVRRLAEAATASTQKVERFVEGLRERTASAIQVLQGASRIEETIPVVYRISDAFVSLVPAVESANRSLGELSDLVAENVIEVSFLRESAEAGMAATTESINRVDRLIRGLSSRR